MDADEITFEQFADAMRVGSPGPCYARWAPDPDVERPRPARWHTISASSIETLRATSTGGVAFCDTCGEAIFVPGRAPDSLVVKGLDVAMKMRTVSTVTSDFDAWTGD